MDVAGNRRHVFMLRIMQWYCGDPLGRGIDRTRRNA